MPPQSTENVHPKWIDNGFFEKILQKREKDNSIIVDKFSVTMATKKGENYASVMFRTKIEYRSDKRGKAEKSFILKCAHEGTADKEMVEELNAFPREYKMMAYIAPEITQLLRSVGDNANLAASAYYYAAEPTEMIVIEDLAARGYKLGDRFHGLDLPHSKEILSKIAKLHAGSLILHQKNPSFATGFGKPVMNEEFTVFHDMILNCLGALIDEVKTWPGYEKYLPKLENLLRTIIQKAINACKVKNNEFAVLCHGDCWTANMMFNYHDNGAVKNGILVDFQTYHWGPPTTDINYFIFTSVANDTRINHLNELIQSYHAEFKSTLMKLDYKGYVPSLQELHIQLLQNKAWGLVPGVVLMPVTAFKPDENEIVTPVTMMGDSPEGRSIRKRCFSSPDVKQRMRALLPYFDQLGLLD